MGLTWRWRGTGEASAEREVDELPAEASESESPVLVAVDAALRHFRSRRVVSASEVVDVLLDLRTAVLLAAAVTELIDACRVSEPPAPTPR